MAMFSIMTSVPILMGLIGAGIVLPWDKTVTDEPLIRNTTATENCGPIDVPEYSRRTVYFPSHGLQLEGWLYLPKVWRTNFIYITSARLFIHPAKGFLKPIRAKLSLTRECPLHLSCKLPDLSACTVVAQDITKEIDITTGVRHCWQH